MIRTARLNTLHMFDGNDHEDKDYPLWEKIAQYMDGELCWVIEIVRRDCGDINFVFSGLMDEEKNKELHYMMEQDSVTGCFINDREAFDKEWEEGKYERDLLFCLGRENVIFEEEG